MHFFEKEPRFAAPGTPEMIFWPPGRSQGGPGSALNRRGGTNLASQKGSALLFWVLFDFANASFRKRRLLRPPNRKSTIATGNVAATGLKR